MTIKNTRAGYVYIISNIGSFGENVYKIGMTRRLDPMDRVRELGDASVPFKFDVHAMIFSEDAPALENALHKKFENKSVNKVNLRKEFFNVSLEEVKKEVIKNHNATIEFTMLAEAQEYRESLAMGTKPIEKAKIEPVETSTNDNEATSKPVNNEEKIAKTMSLNFEEMNYLSLIKRLVSDVVDTNQISYFKNNEYLEINFKNDSSKYICKLFLNKTCKNNIHLFDKEEGVIMFDFDEMNDLEEIKDMFIDIVKGYL
ncbi:MAG: GIY-YIG nuclease family protein [Intestinibacter sp.]|uniref:GIY-YIG nuclease family protein n=1 Tax=Intestinibacter sp. TaxID=1965304 RepID=UPI003F18849C